MTIEELLFMRFVLRIAHMYIHYKLYLGFSNLLLKRVWNFLERIWRISKLNARIFHTWKNRVTSVIFVTQEFLITNPESKTFRVNLGSNRFLMNPCNQELSSYKWTEIHSNELPEITDHESQVKKQSVDPFSLFFSNMSRILWKI